MEEEMLEDYFILVRRIPGINLSPTDYWELDTFTTQKLLELENEIIKIENENTNDKKDTYTEHHKDNAPEVESLIEEMQEDD